MISENQGCWNNITSEIQTIHHKKLLWLSPMTVCKEINIKTAVQNPQCADLIKQQLIVWKQSKAFKLWPNWKTKNRLPVHNTLVSYPFPIHEQDHSEQNRAASWGT